MARPTKTAISTIGLMITCGALITGAFTWRSLATTDPIPVSDGAIFRLTPESQYLHGCFDPCMCPLLMQDGVRGTFKLVHLGFDGAVHEYAVVDVNWTVPSNDLLAPLRITGTGIYLIGSPDPITVVQHRMILDLKIGDGPSQHFDSGWRPLEDVTDLHIRITVSMNNMYCFDTAIVINADLVPEHQIHPYGLVPGSTFQRGCFDPCDCPLGPELPMIGTFALVPLVDEPPAFTEFAVINVDWHVLFDSVSDSIPIRGFGVYQLLGDFTLQHRLALELVVGDEPRTHFDSGIVLGGFAFPLIDAIVTVNNMECDDTVLRVIGHPTGGIVCDPSGVPCPEGRFCKKPVGHCAADVDGICAPIPNGCPDVWDPVCGCDGLTYGNECESDMAAVSLAHYGECGLFCIDDSDCPAPGHFCKFPVGTCGDASVGGLCVTIPEECIQVSDPVCGCDGVTYGNECMADMAAVSIAHHGPCETNCRPTDDGFGCVPVACSAIPEEQCIGTVLQLDPVTGAIFTLACECMDFNLCHIEFGDATPHPVGYCQDGGTCEVVGVDTNGDGIDDWFTAECVAIGACCLDMGGAPLPVPVCTEVPRDVCGPLGAFKGVGTTCAPAQACCLPFADMGYCHDIDPFCCAAFGGVSQGPGSTCADFACGEVCGGLTGIPCPDLETFCKFPEGTCEGADMLGICTSVPHACPEYYHPVCGCNGVTYDNECHADAARVSIAHRGPCEHPCSEVLGLPPCGEGLFCLYPEGTCDDGIHPGICVPIPPPGCPDVWDPVCGCDRVTYGNECEAHTAGASILHRGECDRICRESDPNYPPCEPGEFCKFPVGTCGDPGVPGICMIIPDACPEYYDPVCGCDGITYGNECEADRATVSIHYFGECGGVPCPATRSFSNAPPGTYCPGVPQTVRIVVTPPPGTTTVGIEDAPPYGWVVHNISDDGTFDAVNGKVKWGPFFTPQIPPQVSYEVTPTDDASVVACFDGRISADGLNEQICGDACLELRCRAFMEPDLPQPPCLTCPIGNCTTCPDRGCRDGRITLCELIGYACAWKTGCNDDLAGMTRAAYIWRNGECSCWDDVQDNWFPTPCPPPDSGLCGNEGNARGGSDSIGTATLVTTPAPGKPLRGRGPSVMPALEVPVRIVAPEGTLAMAVEVDIPRGWEVVAASDDGQWDTLHRKVKWGPFFEDLSRTVTFQLERAAAGTVVPKRVVGLASFSGRVSFDGMNCPIIIR